MPYGRREGSAAVAKRTRRSEAGRRGELPPEDGGVMDGDVFDLQSIKEKGPGAENVNREIGD